MIDLENRFEHLKLEYPSIKQKCEGLVVNWRWAKSNRHDPRPFWYERLREKPGRYLKSAPIRPNGLYEYGYDVDGKVVVERNHVFSDPNRIWFYEKFFIYNENSLEVIYFDYFPDKKPINITRCTYENDHLILCETRASRGRSRERYLWDKNRVKIIEVDHADIGAHYYEPIPFQRIIPKYNEIGLLEELTVHWLERPGRPSEIGEVVFRRLEKKVNLRSLLTLAKEQLFHVVLNKVKALHVDEPVYCLAIAWSPGQFNSLPPNIVLGLDRERKEWISIHDQEVKWYLWNPAEFSFWINQGQIFDDEELNNIFELINQECGRCDRWDDAVRMLNEVAKRLYKTDWQGILPVTSDFVVYATDLELGDFRETLKSTITPELLLNFKNKDWLPD